ncbi:MAG: hypothetical protein KatS3mg002_1221 [Candidatus Woesearchaeota archaeon]|nr:MAG: hypothetical protein KatS3mg002_1221 [Candidatus Woesearchaeota archaeon]
MRKKIIIITAVLVLWIFSVIFYSPKYNNSITGKDVYTRVEIIGILPSECNFNLTQGWNYVSFHCIASSVPREQVLMNISGNYSKIFTYTAFDTADPWKSYNPDLPNWTVQQLNYMGRTSGYIILMNNDKEYIFEGHKRSSVVQLKPGWNLVGYPSNISRSINDSLSGLSYNMVLTYENNIMLYYVPGWSNNTLLNFTPNKAYWINSSALQNWLIN